MHAGGHAAQLLLHLRDGPAGNEAAVLLFVPEDHTLPCTSRRFQPLAGSSADACRRFSSLNTAGNRRARRYQVCAQPPASRTPCQRHRTAFEAEAGSCCGHCDRTTQAATAIPAQRCLALQHGGSEGHTRVVKAEVRATVYDNALQDRTSSLAEGVRCTTAQGLQHIRTENGLYPRLQLEVLSNPGLG